MTNSEGRFREEREDTAKCWEDGGGAAMEEDAREVAGGVGEKLEDGRDLALVCGGGGKHVGEEEIGKDGTELGLKGVLTGAGNGGGGGGGCDPLAQFVDEVGEVRHGRRRGFPSPSHWPR